MTTRSGFSTVWNLCAVVAQWIERLPPEHTPSRFTGSKHSRHSLLLGTLPQAGGMFCTTRETWYSDLEESEA